jgi:FtsP/CotA-like multicopper oxidase with cupredoxin domain
MAAGVTLAPRLCLAQATADGFTEVRARKVALGLLEDGAGRADAWLFGNGPEPLILRARQGAPLKLRFINELDSEIWLHFFGVRGPSELMTLNVPPGQTTGVDCAFTPPDAGTFWIGAVADASRVRDMGLSAALIVEEAAPLAGIADMVMVLDDWKLDEAGGIAGNFGDVETMVGEGRLGNWFTVNNRFRPKLQLAEGQFTRLRLINTANVRSMGVLFKGHDPLLIARDGQPLQPAPLDQKALLLAPGQRADLLVSPEEGDIRVALDLFEDIVEIAYLVRDSGTAPPPVIADNFVLPANPLSPLPALTEARTIAVRIEGGIKGGLKSARWQGVEQDLRVLLENGKGWALNGVAGPAAEPLFTAAKGETVVLEIENRTAFSQPIHIHGHVWQELGEEPTGIWQDTAIVATGETMTLAFVADNPGTWAIQSLIAERADGGLIGAFEIAESPGSL